MDQALQGILDRCAIRPLREALSAARVVYLAGARQAGKTTLVQAWARASGATYETLDDQVSRAFALDDPAGFIDRPGPLVIDEAQRAGDGLLLAIKARVDRDPRPGRFLLTGSSRFLTVPRLSESLAGRVDLVDLWPLAQSELKESCAALSDRLFRPGDLRTQALPPASRADVFERVCRGGFPEAVARAGRMRTRWFEAYVRTLTGRDVGEVSNIQRVGDLLALVRLLAARTAAEINVSDVARDAGIPRTTLAAYLPLLEAVFLTFRLPAWSRNVTSKRVKQAKLHFTDTGVAAHVLGISPRALAQPGNRMAGPLLETFVASELARQAGWADIDVALHHFRDRAGPEVDLVLEARDGRVAAVEVKLGRTVGQSDRRGLEVLRDRLGPQFVHGVVLGCFEEVRPLGDRLTALPLSALWA